MTEVQLTTDAIKDALQHQQAQADATNKMAVDSQPAAAPKGQDKPAAAKDDSSWGLYSFVTSTLHKAEDLVASAVDCLPGLHLTDSTAQATAKPVEKAPGPTATSAPSHDTKTAENNGDKPKVETKAVEASVGQKPADFELQSADLRVSYSSKDFTLDDLLKQQGCDNKTGCEVDPKAPEAGLSLSSGQFKLTKAPTSKQVKTGMSDSLLNLTLNDKQWSELFSTYQAETGKTIDIKIPDSKVADGKPAQEAGSIEKTATGYKHLDASGKVDFERVGAKSVRYNGDGSTSELDSLTGDKFRRGPDGRIIIDLAKDGSFSTTLTDGKVLKIAPNGKTLTVNDGTGISTFKKVGTDLVFQQSDADVVSSDKALPSMGDLIASAMDAFSGTPIIHTSKTGTSIQGKDGRLMAIMNDGDAMISIDQHSWMTYNKDKQVEIHYNDGRKTAVLTQEQLATMTSDKKATQELIAAFEALKEFGKTGTLQRAQGGSLKSVANGPAAAQYGAVSTSGTPDKLTIHDTKRTFTEVVNVPSQTVNLLDLKGKALGVVDLSGDTIGIKTPEVQFKNGVATAADGTVYSQAGIKFTDGTNFQNNGNITDGYGTTYNTSGEAIAFEKPAEGGASDTSKNNEETQAKAQVSQAESMASSILGKVSGGHATAGDIAALLGSFEKLTALVGSLAQFSDPSLMATAVIAQGEVAGSIEIAYAALNRNTDTAAQVSQNAGDAATTAAGAGGRTLAPAGNNY